MWRPSCSHCTHWAPRFASEPPVPSRAAAGRAGVSMTSRGHRARERYAAVGRDHVQTAHGRRAGHRLLGPRDRRARQPKCRFYSRNVYFRLSLPLTHLVFCQLLTHTRTHSFILPTPVSSVQILPPLPIRPRTRRHRSSRAGWFFEKRYARLLIGVYVCER